MGLQILTSVLGTVFMEKKQQGLAQFDLRVGTLSRPPADVESGVWRCSTCAEKASKVRGGIAFECGLFQDSLAREPRINNHIVNIRRPRAAVTCVADISI